MLEKEKVLLTNICSIFHNVYKKAFSSRAWKLVIEWNLNLFQTNKILNLSEFKPRKTEMREFG